MPRGSEPGERRGGRGKGTPNKTTAVMLAEIAKGGETPLEYMLRVMRDPSTEHPRRDDMSKAAAPYVHNRLAAIEHTGADGGPLIVKITQQDADLV